MDGKWVPHLLTEENKYRGVNICSNFFSRYKKKNFLHKVITVDEKWIAYDSPERRKSWLDPGQQSPSFPKPNIHDKKILLCVWWDWKGIIHYELLERGQTVTCERYEAQLNKLADVLKEKKPFTNQGTRSVLLLYDNAIPCTAKSTWEAILSSTACGLFH